jgi:hypothetical protein
MKQGASLGAAILLSLVNETTNSAGQVVQQLAATSGALIQVTRDAAGNVVNLRVVQQAAGGQ